MRIGIISDTHDDVPMIKEVIRRLNGLEVSLLLHAGDYVSPFTAKPYSELKAKMIGVLGNNCAERERLREVYAAVGKEIVGSFAEVEVGGRRIALLHGHDDVLLRSLIAHGCYDVVVHGHDHKVKVEKCGSTLVINPGEVCGYISGKSSFGILETDRLEVDIHDL
jgi:putative phosphoesterase